MSEEKKMPDEAEDPELNDLLDSALKDLDKQSKATILEKGNDASVLETKSKTVSKEEITVEQVWTEDFINQAADQFQRNFEELMQNSSGSTVGESFKKLAQSVTGEISEYNDDGVIPNFQSAINQALKDLSATTENLQNVPNISESDLAGMFEQTSLDSGSYIFPFMQGMMQSLLSKEVLYGPLKDLVDRYPIWLNKKKATLLPADLANYEKQLKLMQKVCSELETEKSDNTEQEKKIQFEKILSLMQEMQSCGQPPPDLINESSLFRSETEKNAEIPFALPGKEDSQNCSVM